MKLESKEIKVSQKKRKKRKSKRERAKKWGFLVECGDILVGLGELFVIIIRIIGKAIVSLLN